MHPTQEFRPVPVGHAKDFAQGVERKARGKCLDHVAFAFRRHLVDQAGHLGCDPDLEGVEIGRGEERHVLAAQLHVLRRIHVDHCIERGAAQQHVPNARLGRVHQYAATPG